MGTRAQVATSACFVVSGLFMCGLGGVLAVAELEPAQANNGAAQIDEVEANSVHDSIRLVSGEGDADGADNESKTDSDGSDGNTPKVNDAKTGDGARDQGQAEQDQQDEPELGQGVVEQDDDSGTTGKSGTTDPVTQTAETASSAVQSPPIAEPPVPCEVREGCQTPTTTPTTTTTRNGWPGPGGGGGSGGTGGGALPSSSPEPPPMQLPSQAPTIISAAPGVDVATGEGPTAITLPVIVAPAAVPALVPSLGAGGGGPAVPANPALPAAPRAVTADPPAAPRAVSAEPPAGRNPPPANVGNNPFVPAPNFRIGYTEYLRSAGIPQVAALAVPGIVGMLVFTAAGGLIGYRQAKAGHAVHTGVAARFVK